MEISEMLFGKNHGKLAHLQILAPKIFHGNEIVLVVNHKIYGLRLWQSMALDGPTLAALSMSFFHFMRRKTLSWCNGFSKHEGMQFWLIQCELRIQLFQSMKEVSPFDARSSRYIYEFPIYTLKLWVVSLFFI